MKMEIKNGVIDKTDLFIEDHGILTFFLYISGEGWGQGFGGYGCDNSDFLSEAVRKILETLDKHSWESLPGTPVRIEGDHGHIYRIGHFMKDKWYDIDKHAKSKR